ncbi:MAG: hypothetical protein ACI4HI_09490 [Lachnospiraceae bacterium]
MAKFWGNLDKHPDTVEKHKITEEEIQFLKSIQKEMNTQDHLGQADPRYWVIRNYKKVYGENISSADGISICEKYGWTTLLEVDYQCLKMDDIIEKILNTFKDEGYELSENTIENIKSAYDFRSLNEALQDIEEYELYVTEYLEMPSDEGVFFTHEAAIQHLKNNSHHYSVNAHTYAKTAWRSSEEKLWSILQSVDFDKLN